MNTNLGSGLILQDLAAYSGIYMEDGSDAAVSDVLMIVVKNTGTQDIQYAEIEIPAEGMVATFKLTSLPVGDRVLLLEQGRMPHSDSLDPAGAVAKNVIYFRESMSLREDLVKIQGLDGKLQVTNVSDGDISGDIVVYYKNSASDLLYGGITYRVSISGGLKANETKEVTAGHFSVVGSRVMFVTCG